jgi:hypothetical protein
VVDDAAYTNELLMAHPGMAAHLQRRWPAPTLERAAAARARVYADRKRDVVTPSWVVELAAWGRRSPR